MSDLRTPTKKRPVDSDNTSVEEDEGYDTDATVLASPYNIEKQRGLEREYNKEKLNRQNREYERRQLIQQETISPTIILDRKTENPFYIKNSEGQLETVTSTNIRDANTFYNKDGEPIVPEFLLFGDEKGGKIRRKHRRTKKAKKSKKTRKSRKLKKSRKYK
jgi:hypothetical protein